MGEASGNPTWQCLLICWGDKYHSEYINHTIEAVIRNSTSKPRFVLISDRPRPGLHPDVQVVDFDPWWLQKQFRTISLQAKLYMFEKGVIPDDLPTVYIDLDTAVLGDLSQAINLLRTPKSMLMVQSVVLPFGWPGRLVYRLTNKKRYARGNSSIVVFHPSECSYISETFKRLYEEHGGFGIRPMIAAEVDDMAMLRLIARQHPGVAVVPPVVVKDELANGVLVEIEQLPHLHESFFAITSKRQFPNPLLTELLGKPNDDAVADAS